MKISIFGIRGKMPNAFVTPTKKYFENEEVSGLFKIFGYDGYSKKFDPDKFKPEKVVIATDADADGAHVRVLVLSLFLRYLPFCPLQPQAPFQALKSRSQSPQFHDFLRAD